MSLSISGVHSVAQGPSADPPATHTSASTSTSPAQHSAPPKPSVPASSDALAIPTLTLAQHAQELANSGLSKEQIATSLGLTVTQVLTSLHENTPTTTSAAPDLVALSARLSITV